MIAYHPLIHQPAFAACQKQLEKEGLLAATGVLLGYYVSGRGSLLGGQLGHSRRG